MICFVTVDTEEDNWGDYGCRDGAVENIDELPGFQALCDAFSAVPTYLVNWPVAAKARSRAIVRELLASGRCEVGTHCHPWNTPPIEEVIGPASSWLTNLPPELIRAKLVRLHQQIQEAFDVEPVTFRGGRWAFGATVAAVLEELGYLVESSVTPFVDWSLSQGPDYGGAPLRLHRFGSARPDIPMAGGRLLEVPPTIGVMESRQKVAASAYRVFRTVLGPRHRRRVEPWGSGLGERLGMASLRWLSPEHSSAEDMIRLAESLRRQGYSWLNVPLHSVTLMPGRTPFVQTRQDRERFLETIREFLAWARDAGIRFAPLSASSRLLAPGSAEAECV